MVRISVTQSDACSCFDVVADRVEVAQQFSVCVAVQSEGELLPPYDESLYLRPTICFCDVKRDVLK